MFELQRFDSYLGWVTFATCATHAAAVIRRERVARAAPAATLRIVVA